MNGKRQRIDLDRLIDRRSFAALARQYRSRYGFTPRLFDAEGLPLDHKAAPDPGAILQATRATLTEGSTVIIDRGGDHRLPLLWAVPLMLNEAVVGAVAVAGPVLDDGMEDDALSRLRESADGLLRMMREANLINASRLDQARQRAGRERHKAEAIHLVKSSGFASIRELYGDLEDDFLTAIRRGNTGDARELLNRVLVAIYNFGSVRRDLLKSYLLELVTMMTRAAVEAGAHTEEALGINFQSIQELSRIEDDQAIDTWLLSMLERLMATIRRSAVHPNRSNLERALQYIEDNLDQKLRRETVARQAGFSPGHFTHLLNEHYGKTFREFLLDRRIRRATELLMRSDQSLADIALACGFADQSHFSRVFSKATGQSPRDYRRGVDSSNST